MVHIRSEPAKHFESEHEGPPTIQPNRIGQQKQGSPQSLEKAKGGGCGVVATSKDYSHAQYHINSFSLRRLRGPLC